MIDCNLRGKNGTISNDDCAVKGEDSRNISYFQLYSLRRRLKMKKLFFLLLLYVLIYLGYDYVNEALFSQEKVEFQNYAQNPKEHLEKYGTF